MSNRLKPHELESLIRSAAMAPLAAETTRRVLFEHQELLHEHEELKAVMARLAPAWADLRTALNEVARMVSDR